MAAWIVGIMILYGAGWKGGVVLAAFFVSSNVVSKLARPTAPAQLDAKGERRDAWQVLANGGPAAVAAVLPVEVGLKLWLITASLAAAAADTWATSVGSRSKTAPRLLGSGRSVYPGASGGVTPAGCVGAFIGAMLVSGTGALALGSPALFAAGTLIGFLGMLGDSLVGGMWQGSFYCAQCSQPSEWRVHRCGCATEWKAGLAWLTNDGVNLLATTLALVAGWTSWAWFD